ncbi:MAG: twin-arginine translocase subunit TatC [Actinobacteria bacterium]|nr:twin-arginine translocase subunit TatC [Actinomycetota bacterium]
MAIIPRLRRRGPKDPGGTMTIIEHLEELRYRLVLAIGSIGVGSIAGWFLYPPVIRILKAPYCRYQATVPEASRLTRSCTFIYLSPLDGVLIKLKVVVFLGLAIALPFVLYQLWAFIVPGLKSSERRMAIPFVLSSTVLFALGTLVAYVTLPKALGFLLGFAGPSNFTAVLTGDRYLSFAILVAVAFGISFEFPLVLIFLSMVGIISSQKMRSSRRPALLFISIFAAIITPSSDPYSMLAMTIPMYLFYEAAIIVTRLMGK